MDMRFPFAHQSIFVDNKAMAETKPAIPPVFFNHLYLVLDDKTYRAILASDFLRIAFPGVEHRSTLTAQGETWSGAYYYCQDTYLEFFGSRANPMSGSSVNGHWQPGAQEGWAGLAFSTSRPGGAAAVRGALQAAFKYEPYAELRQLIAGEKKVNWFTTVRLAERLGMGSFDAWLMEYHPDIFIHKGIPLPASGELSARDYLSQWNRARRPARNLQTDAADALDSAAANHSGKFKETSGTVPPAAPSSPPIAPPVFSNIIEATIHMDSRRAARLAETLALLGYAQEQVRETLLLSAHGFSLRICPEEDAPAGYRLSALRLAMSRPSVAPMTFVFAPRARLVLNEDQTADWFFGE
jgi:hypothetical protein